MKYFSQTLEYLDKLAINESAHSASYQNFGVAVLWKEEMLTMKFNPFCNKSSIWCNWSHYATPSSELNLEWNLEYQTDSWCY